MLRYLSGDQSSSEFMDYGYQYTQKTSYVSKDRSLTRFDGFHLVGQLGYTVGETGRYGYSPCFSNAPIGNIVHCEKDLTLDKLQTSPMHKYGDHDCYHSCFDATLIRDSSKFQWTDASDPDGSTAQSFNMTLPMLKTIHGRGGSIYLPTRTTNRSAISNLDQIALPLNQFPNFDFATEYIADCNSSISSSDWSVLTGRYAISLKSAGGSFPAPVSPYLTKMTDFDYMSYGFSTSIRTIKVDANCPLYYCVVSSSAMLRYQYPSRQKVTAKTYEAYSYKENACMLAYFVSSIGTAQVYAYKVPTTLASNYSTQVYYDVIEGSSRTTAGNKANVSKYYLDRCHNPRNDVTDAANMKSYYAGYIPTSSSVSRKSWYYSTWAQNRLPLGLTQPEAAAARNYIWSNYRKFWLDKPEPTSHMRGNVAYEATKLVKTLDINSLAFIKDLPELIALVKDTFAILKDIKNPPKLASEVFSKDFWSGLYLQYRYGITLTAADTKEILQSISKKINSSIGRLGKVKFTNARVYTTEAAFSRCMAYKLYYEPLDSKILQALKNLQDLDLYPDLSNSWDLIPFSFIIDWFVDVGTIFEKDDIVNYWQYLNITSCVWSFKDVAKPTSGLVKIGGLDVAMSDFTIKRYARKVQSSPDYPSFDLNNGSGLSSTHILDAGAIIIQR